MTSTDVALKSLRREIDTLRQLVSAPVINAVKRYYSGYLLPPGGNVPRGSTDEDRIFVKDEWDGLKFLLTSVPTALPGTSLQKIRLDSSANGMTIRIKYVCTSDTNAYATMTFRMSWTLRCYEDASLISTTTGDRPITKQTRSDDGFRTNDAVEQEFSFQYITWDNSVSPTFNANGDLPIKGYPLNRHVELDVVAKGREYDGSNPGKVFEARYDTIPSTWQWIGVDGTVNTSGTIVVAPTCEIIEF